MMTVSVQSRVVTGHPPASSGRRPAFSIVIVSWNTSALLARCLAALIGDLQAGDVSAEVFVVDNASQDDTIAMVSRRFPQVELICNHENLGFAAANNRALARVTGEYVLLLNPDTEVAPGALLILKRFMDAHADAGAAGPQLMNPDGSPQASTFPLPTLWRELLRMFHLDKIGPSAVYIWRRTGGMAPRRVDGVQGACMLLRRQAIDEVGVLDEDYFIYSEEVDLCYRLARAGWQIFWVPQARVMHYGGQSTQQAAAAMFFRLYEAKVLYFRKHKGPAAVRAYKLILAAATLTRLLLAPLAPRGPAWDTTVALAARYRHLLALLPEL